MAFATEGRTPGEIVARLLSHADASGGIGRESLDTEKRLFRVQAWDDRSTRVALDRYSLYRQEHRRASSGAPPVSCCTPLRLRYPPNLVFARFLFQSIAAASQPRPPTAQSPMGCHPSALPAATRPGSSGSTPGAGNGRSARVPTEVPRRPKWPGTGRRGPSRRRFHAGSGSR